MLRRVVFSIVALTLSIDQTHVSAFALAPLPTSTLGSFAPNSALQASVATVPPTPTASASIMPPSADVRGGEDKPQEPKPMKRVRITALDGIRFLLATHIVLGHFLRFANPSTFLLKFFSQVNVTVGAFFALSGYVTAYTSTEVAQRKVSPKLTATPAQKWWLSKVMAYYPMHWLVCTLFAPMFLYSDFKYVGSVQAGVNALLSYTLTQAWMPMHAEVWNAPTWFLSSMAFSTALLPFCLPKIAEMDKKGLRRTGFWLFLVKLLPILGYCHDTNSWGVVEGMTAPKHMPNLAAFNAQRFHPVFNVAEILMGVVACRLAMLDKMEDKENNKPIKTNALSTLVPLLGLIAGLVLRSGFVPDFSDLLFRSVFFVPLFLKFVMGAHRNAVDGVNDPVANFLSSKMLVWLGGLSFPIFVVHGPIGQVFFKKAIATKVFGKVLKGPTAFAGFVGTVFVSALLVQNLFLQNKSVGEWSKKRVDQFAAWF